MPSRSSPTNVAAESGPPPSRSRRTSADPTITPSASAHTAAAYIGGGVRLLIPLGIIAVVFAVGLWFFNREAPRIAERL